MMQMQMQMHVQGKSFSIGSCMELAPTRVQATGFTCRNTGEMWKKRKEEKMMIIDRGTETEGARNGKTSPRFGRVAS